MHPYAISIDQSIIIGQIKDRIQAQQPKHTEIYLDNEDTLTLSTTHWVTLKCGDSSITPTKDEKILLRGKYISSRASGIQTIKGGSVQIN